MEFEINMINVEDGDAIILQLFKEDKKALIVIDGGYRRYYSKLINRINELLPNFDNKIELIIGTHYDNDHLEGLSLLLDDCKKNNIDIGEIWMHKIEESFDKLVASMNERLSIEVTKAIPQRKRNAELSGSGFDEQKSNLVVENYTFLRKLLEKIIEYNLESKIKEVKQGDYLDGFEEFKVISPTPDFYNSLLPSLREEKFFKEAQETQLLTEDNRTEKSFEEQVADTMNPCNRLQTSSVRNGVTSTNLVSIVTLLQANDLKFLFTADAGIESFQNQNLLTAELKNLDWLQLPHHGSKNNSSKIMLDHFNPRKVFVSGKSVENRPDSTIVKCLNTEEKRLESIDTTNDNSDTWYLKIDHDLKIERVLIS